MPAGLDKVRKGVCHNLAETAYCTQDLLLGQSVISTARLSYTELILRNEGKEKNTWL